jgi:hypothetical protein
MTKIKHGSTVRVGTQRSIPLRYQGRQGVVVGKATNSRGTQQLLVAFPGRRANPLAVNEKFATTL